MENICIINNNHIIYQVNQPLDYERIKEYNLTIRVEVGYNQDKTNISNIS